MMIRPALESDAAAIAGIWNGYIRETFVTFNSQEKETAALAIDIGLRQAEGKAFLVAERSGRIVGFATYSQFRPGIGYARTMEHTILLSPDFRGQGGGRALMSAVEDHARAGGAHSLIGGVSALNPPGIAFHEALGFVRVGTLPEVGFKFGRWIDLVLLQKRL